MVDNNHSFTIVDGFLNQQTEPGSLTLFNTSLGHEEVVETAKHLGCSCITDLCRASCWSERLPNLRLFHSCHWSQSMLSEARCFAAHATWLMGTTFHAKLHAKRRHLGHLLLPGVRLAYLAYLGWSLAEYCNSECGQLDIFCDGLDLECRWLWTSTVFRNRFLAQYSLIGAAGICKSSRFRCSLLSLNSLLSLLLPFIFSSSSSSSSLSPSSSLPPPPPPLVLCFFFQFPVSSCSWSVSSFTLFLFTTLWYCIERQKVMVSPDMHCKDGAMEPKFCPPVLSTPYLPSPSWPFRLFRYGPSRVRFGMVWFFFVSRFQCYIDILWHHPPIVSEHGTPMLLVCSSLFWGVLVGACTFHPFPSCLLFVLHVTWCSLLNCFRTSKVPWCIPLSQVIGY